MRKSTIWILLFFTSELSISQDIRVADSLESFLAHNKELTDSAYSRVLRNLIEKSSEPSSILKYSNLLLEKRGLSNQRHYIRAHIAKGVAYRMKGDLELSIESLFQGSQLALQFQELDLLAESFVEIATTYMANSDSKNALIYDNKAIEVFREQNKPQELAINLLNTGYTYYDLNILDSALLLYNEAEPLFDSVGLVIGKAYVLGNRALVYWKQGDSTTAEKDLLQAIDMLRPLGDQYGMADYHNQLGRLYAERNDIASAIEHTVQALQMAQDLDLKEQIRDASLLLSELYEEQQDYSKAFQYQKQYIAYKDSIENTESTKKMADLRTEFEVNLREKEIDLLEERQLLNRTYIIIAVILLVFAIVVLLYFRQRFLNTRLIAAQERKQHDEKIKNLLSGQETKALQSMVKGQESERKRLAQDLHNHFGSLLATIKVNINGIDEEAIPNHGTLTKLIDQACTDIRNASHELNMGISNDFGLVPALKELVEHLKKANDLKVEFSASLGKENLQVDDEIVIYRIIQELISNVLKHAQASKLSISLTYFAEEDLMNILVHDNGKGFDINTVDQAKSGIGLNSLIRMVQDLQGEISFDSNPSSGTTVNIDLPITPQELEVI